MAQQTAFLNSDAPNFNKDFHHTMVTNYLLNNAGVLFSDLVIKPEFVLGNGQISSGSALVKCTRTTGVFTGEEILATFKSTATEPIDTTGDKKIYIEIPEGYVNNSTTITQALTGGVNLNVGRLVSAATYPVHTNYIPLWEVTAGDWAGALDVRPVIRKFGKKDSVVYFDTNGVEQNIDLNPASIGQYLKSQGPGNPVIFDNPSAAAEIAATKFRFIAGENLLQGDFFYNDILAEYADTNTDAPIGDALVREQRSFKIIGNGVSASTINLKLKHFGSPADNFIVEIQTDIAGKPSGVLAHVNATGTISGGALALIYANVLINFAGAFALSDQTVYHLVCKRSGVVSGANYYVLGLQNIETDAYIQHIFDGAVWGSDLTSNKLYTTFDGMYNGLRCKTDASSLSKIDWEGICILNTTIGFEFVADTRGVSQVFTGLQQKEAYFLSNTPGLITTSPGLNSVFVGTALNEISLSIASLGSSGSSGSTYDAIIDATGLGDYTTIGAAIAAGNQYLFVREGVYNETVKRGNLTKPLYIMGEDVSLVDINISVDTIMFVDVNTVTITAKRVGFSISAATGSWNFLDVGSSGNLSLFENVRFSINNGVFGGDLIDSSGGQCEFNECYFDSTGSGRIDIDGSRVVVENSFFNKNNFGLSDITIDNVTFNASTYELVTSGIKIKNCITILWNTNAVHGIEEISDSVIGWSDTTIVNIGRVLNSTLAEYGGTVTATIGDGEPRSIVGSTFTDMTMLVSDYTRVTGCVFNNGYLTIGSNCKFVGNDVENTLGTVVIGSSSIFGNNQVTGTAIDLRVATTFTGNYIDTISSFVVGIGAAITGNSFNGENINLSGSADVVLVGNSRVGTVTNVSGTAIVANNS